MGTRLTYELIKSFYISYATDVCEVTSVDEDVAVGYCRQKACGLVVGVRDTYKAYKA